MILEGIINLVVESVVVALGMFEAVNIPVHYIATLGKFASYGSYVVGADLLLIFCGVVLSWSAFKMIMGITLFLWRLLPLT